MQCDHAMSSWEVKDASSEKKLESKTEYLRDKSCKKLGQQVQMFSHACHFVGEHAWPVWCKYQIRRNSVRWKGI